ncbi:hypothetical protein [Tenacibaculum maritimum]
MNQEIYYKAEIQINPNQSLLEIESKGKLCFIEFKVLKVKGNFLTIELSHECNAEFTGEEIKSFIYEKLSKQIEFFEITFLELKEETEIYSPLN